jgi:peptidoglycan hydrolase CwlO-like protein/surface antigen
MKEVMIKQRVQKIRRAAVFNWLLTGLLVAALIVAGIPHVLADQFDEKIRQLQQQNSENQQQVAQLQVQAGSYQEAINKLQAQIDGLQAAINANQTKQADLQARIDSAQKELDKQKRVLGENIRAMYLEGQISTLEMLASSKDLSDFVDKEQYRNSVKDKIRATLDKITQLKNQLRQQQEEVKKLLEDQKKQQSQLSDTKEQQAKLLAYNQQQQDDFNQKIQNNNSQIAGLKAQQAAENARLFGGTIPKGIPGGGGYPGAWAFAPMDSVLDSWGMYNRECVSYTAWKVASTGRYMPYWGGIGNAWEWAFDGWASTYDGHQTYSSAGSIWHVANATAAGIPMDTSPRVGDVAIKNGVYGHAMYVEAVYGDGTIFVSQYNAGLDGYYSTARISASGLRFIHF